MIELCGILISELSNIKAVDSEELCSNALFLISQPVDKEQSVSEYISRNLQYTQLKDRINTDLSVGNLWNEVKGIKDNTGTSSVLSCNSKFPYILSSYVFKNGGLISAEGYPLSAGMDMTFKSVSFDVISCTTICAEYGSGGGTIEKETVFNGNTTFNGDNNTFNSSVDFNSNVTFKNTTNFTENVTFEKQISAQSITLNGNLSVNGTISLQQSYYPSEDSDIATKKYVDDQCSKASGTVKSVNSISSDSNGNIELSCYKCEEFKFYTKDDPETPITYKIMLSSS